MIWHIFKKDWKLFRGFGLAVALLPFAIAVVRYKLEPGFDENEALSSVLLLLELMLYFGAATLTAVLVQLDGLVSVRQDWLVRPVRRRDLLAAKLLFLLLAVHLPLFVANLAVGVAEGFPLSSLLAGAFTENLYFLLGFTLPILAFASLSRNLTEALGGAFALFVAVMGLEMLITGWNGGSPLGPTTDSGVAWIPQTERLLIYLFSAAAILALQYFRRATRASRFVFGAAIVLCMITQVVPWHYAFSLQMALSGRPAASDPITLQFDPSQGKYHSPVASKPHPALTQMGISKFRNAEDNAAIYIPLEISGVAPGSILKVDHAAVRLVGANGKSVGATSPAGERGAFEAPNENASGSSALPYYEPVHIRSSVFNRLKDTPVTLQIDYSATLLRLSSTDMLPALDASQRIAGVGWCRSELNDNRTAIEVRCLGTGTLPQCSSLVLENPATGVHNPANHGCLDDYAAYLGRYKPPDTLLRIGTNLFFRDDAGLVHYPVDASQIGNAQVVLKNYAVAGHLTTRLVVPAIRLADWSAD